MRIPESCGRCGGASVVYATIHGAAFTVRYRKCRTCNATSKGISMNQFLLSNELGHIEQRPEIMRAALNSFHIEGKTHGTG